MSYHELHQSGERMLTSTHMMIIAHIVVFAVTFSDILTRPKMILAWYGRILEWIEMKPWGWIAYPIGYCAKCTAGHIALWVFGIRLFTGWEDQNLALIRWIVFCSAAILISEILSAWLKKLTR